MFERYIFWRAVYQSVVFNVSRSYYWRVTIDCQRAVHTGIELAVCYPGAEAW